MRVVESFVAGKAGDPAACEDLVVEAEHFVAVIDGATDKTGVRYEGMTGGRFAAEVLAQTIRALPPDAEMDACVDALSSSLAGRLEASEGSEEPDRPNAVLVIVSAYRRELWRVGDVAFALDEEAHVERKYVDTVAAEARTARLWTELLAGASEASLLAQDPGRAMILPLLRSQWTFRNQERVARYAHGTIDGTPVPLSLRQRVPLEDTREVIVCTDGYPAVWPTLDEAEERLARSLEQDPLRIREFPATKGVRPGHASFDDRAYVRMRLD